MVNIHEPEANNCFSTITQVIIAGEPWRGSILFFIIARRRQNLSDVKLKTCTVDCVFYIWAIQGAFESFDFEQFSRSARNQGHDK